MTPTAESTPVHGTPVLVTGGTGHLGRDLVEHLLAKGHRVRLFSREQGSDDRVEWALGDLATGDGLVQAFSGVKNVIHAATNSPIARRGSMRFKDLLTSPDDVDVVGTNKLLRIAEQSQVHHLIYVSIVGLEDSSLPYSRIKLAGERAVTESDLPWSVVRATPYFYLVARMLSKLHRWPAWPLPTAPFQAVHTTDVAKYLVECLEGARRGMHPPIGGPEITSYARMAAEYQTRTGTRSRIWHLKIPEKFARQAGIVVATGGVKGVTRWSRWLDSEYPAF